jgi:hypothetical protein
MSDINASGVQMTVGLEVGDKHIHACFLDHHGSIVEESRLAATASALRRRFGDGERHRVILEAGLRCPNSATRQSSPIPVDFELPT